MHIFILLLRSLLSANSGSPHLRNSFYMTSQKSPWCIHWHSLRKYAINQKGIRRPARGCKYGERAGNNTKLDEGNKTLGKIASKYFFYLQRCSESLRTHSSDDSRSLQMHSVFCVLWPAESMKRKLPFSPDSSIHSVSSTPPVHNK